MDINCFKAKGSVSTFEIFVHQNQSLGSLIVFYKGGINQKVRGDIGLCDPIRQVGVVQIQVWASLKKLLF